MSWRESRAGRLPKCMSEAAAVAALWVFERLWATKWVRRVSSRGGVIAVTFSAHTGSHLVAAAHGQNVHCLLLLSCSKPFCVASLNRTHRRERRSAPHTHPLQRQPYKRLCIFSADFLSHTHTHNTPSLPLSTGDCITFTLFYRHSLPLCFVLLIIIIISQVEPRLTH